MRVQVTQKQIKKSFTNIIEVGYCNLAYLLQGEYSNYYTAGVYGWNADIYQIDRNTCIVTGYRTFGNITPNYELTKKYNTKAMNIWKNKKTYAEQKKEVNKLLNEYINITLNK